MSKCFMMIGLPGSGKSYEAEKIAEKENAIIVSSDAIGKEINGTREDGANSKRVLQVAHKRVKELLASGHNVIMDSTNISCRRRSAWVREMRRYASEMIAVLMATPFELCVYRQSLRERKVEEKVITRMYHEFYVPYFYEGWDRIEVVYPENVFLFRTNHANALLNGLSDFYKFDQKNPHHKLTLGEHMHQCYEYVSGLTDSIPLKEAALLHDIGKAKTQTFDENGGAHYYQHHCVSGYDSLFEKGACESIPDKLLRAAYMQWHMEPYFWREDKTKKRYRNLWGEEFFNNLMILHEGDKKAH